MSKNVRYQVIDPDNAVIANEDNLLAAIESAFTHNGYGFRMERNAAGNMVAVCSERQLGNNVFGATVPSTTLYPVSNLEDDEAAKHDLAEQLYHEYGLYGEAHIHLPLLIQKIEAGD